MTNKNKPSETKRNGSKPSETEYDQIMTVVLTRDDQFDKGLEMLVSRNSGFGQMTLVPIGDPSHKKGGVTTEVRFGVLPEGAA